MVDLIAWTYSLPTVSARKGRSIIAQQFTAGTRKRLVPFDKSRRDGRKPARRVQPSLRDGRTHCSTHSPSDESLGYCQATLRVEIRGDGFWMVDEPLRTHPPFAIQHSMLGWQLNCHPNESICPLSQRERGVFLVYWPLTTGHWPLNFTSASAMRSRAARLGRWPTAQATTAPVSAARPSRYRRC